MASSVASSTRSDSSLLVSEARKRIFSSIKIWPGLSDLAFSPTPEISGENKTSCFSNSPNFLAMGARDNSGFTIPFGLPKCAITTIEQLAASNFFIVDNDAIMRPGSPITPSLMGTFKSQRKITFAFWGFNWDKVLIPI